MGVQVTLNTGPLDALLAGWGDGVGKLLDTIANDVLAEAQGIAPVRTGNLRNSGRVEPGDDQYSRYVHFTAEYAAYVEFGTRFMSARPFLTPAVEHHRRSFQDGFSALIGSLVER